MIIKKRVNINNKYFNHICSDSNLCIKKVGTEEIYEDVYDLPSAKYEYEETDMEIKIEDTEDDVANPSF